MVSFGKKTIYRQTTTGSLREMKNTVFLLNERFDWTSDFIESKSLLNERFYWTIVQSENERKRWKMSDNFENEQNNLLNNFKKIRTKWVVHERWMKEMEKTAPISTTTAVGYDFVFNKTKSWLESNSRLLVPQLYGDLLCILEIWDLATK